MKLRGRARKITFHVFDQRFIEDVLDRGMPDIWREEDTVRLRKTGGARLAGLLLPGPAKVRGMLDRSPSASRTARIQVSKIGTNSISTVCFADGKFQG